MLSISPILMRPSIDVPRTKLIGLTDAALKRPTPTAGRSAIASAIVIVIAVVPVTVIPICGGWSRAADCDYANYTHCCSDLP